MTDPITQAAAEAACRTHVSPERIADHPDPRMAVAACFECQRRAADVVAAVTPLIRAQIAGPCICNGNPATTQGPEEDCPQHGRPYAYWVEGVGVLQQRLAAVLELADHKTRETAGGQQ